MLPHYDSHQGTGCAQRDSKDFSQHPNDTTLSREVRKAAVFKYDAMSYLRSKVLPPNVLLEQKISADSLNACIKMLNEQAYAMNQYVTLYQKRLSEARSATKAW